MSTNKNLIEIDVRIIVIIAIEIFHLKVLDDSGTFMHLSCCFQPDIAI
jgi:hypothetical protein